MLVRGNKTHARHGRHDVDFDKQLFILNHTVLDFFVDFFNLNSQSRQRLGIDFANDRRSQRILRL